MRPLFSVLLACLAVCSCWQGDSNQLKVDVRKALKSPVSSQDLYSKADVIPLHYPGETSLGQEGRVVMDVATDRFFLLDKEKDEILVFDWNGSFLTSLKSDGPIIDFYVYQDRLLEVLTEKAILEYVIEDCSLSEVYMIQDNDITLKCLGRVDDDTISIIGFQSGDAYDCGYNIGKKRFSSVARPAPDYLSTHSYTPASEVQNSRFFRCDDSVYSFQSHSGEIYGYTKDDFIWPAFVFDFGGCDLSVTNVQKTSDRIYLAFELEGADHVLVYNLDRKGYKAVRQTKEGAAFPLGVIYAGINYYCCPSSHVNFYLPSEPGSEKDRLAIIRYSL